MAVSFLSHPLAVLCIPVFFCLPISVITSPFYSQRPCQPLGFMEGNSTANLPAPCPSVHPEASASLPKALKTTVLQQKSNGAFLILIASAFPHYLPLGAITVSFWNHRRLASVHPRADTSGVTTLQSSQGPFLSLLIGIVWLQAPSLSHWAPFRHLKLLATFPLVFLTHCLEIKSP